ncbi:MAG: hypothetical protein Q8919_08160 [Bacteroidota bacterium]|nr:hypothetical protein [Bacteroidota bacterium]
MYTAKIDFETEKEHVELTRGKFATAVEASEFVLEFIRPYIEDCAKADGEWEVFETDIPSKIHRHYLIRSVRSMRADDLKL